MVCKKCGQEHLTKSGKPSCPGHRKPCPPGCAGHANGKPCRTAGPCRRSAGYGTGHKGRGLCTYHGGDAPSGKLHAQKLAAADALATYGLPVEGDPVVVLLEEIARTNGHVVWLEGRVRELDPDALVWGKTTEVEKQASEFPGVDTTHAAGVNVWLDLLRWERRHLADVCVKAIAAGIAKRQIELAEAQGARAFDLFTEALEDAAVSPEVKARVYDALRRLIIRRAA